MPNPELTATRVCAFALLLLLLSADQVFAKEGRNRNAAACDAAITLASREFEVPANVLKALARTESGVTIDGTFVAWPWTLNVEGRGVRFSSLQEALTNFRKHYEQGARNIDLGCFQVNHRWHGDSFASIQDMLDPDLNARYAAKFLRQLYSEFGSWTAAAGAFHSRTAEFSKIYLARFIPILKGLNGTQAPRNGSTIAVHAPNEFPLLTGTSRSRASGSLFPIATRTRRSLISSREARG